MNGFRNGLNVSGKRLSKFLLEWGDAFSSFGSVGMAMDYIYTHDTKHWRRTS